MLGYTQNPRAVDKMGQITLIEIVFLMLNLRPGMMVRDKSFNIILNTNPIKFEKFTVQYTNFLWVWIFGWFGLSGRFTFCPQSESDHLTSLGNSCNSGGDWCWKRRIYMLICFISLMDGAFLKIQNLAARSKKKKLTFIFSPIL